MKNRILKTAGGLVLALSLVLGLAAPALAASDTAPLQAGNTPREVLTGEVVSIDENQEYLVILSGDEKITISVNDDTRYGKFSPLRQVVAESRNQLQITQQTQSNYRLVQKYCIANQAVTEARNQLAVEQRNRVRLMATERFRSLTRGMSLDDVAVGDNVAVWVVEGEDNPLAVLVVLVDPVDYVRVSGTVAGLSDVDQTITVSLEDGSGSIVVSYDEDTRFCLCGTSALAEGDTVIVVYTEMEDGTLLAGSVVSGLQMFGLSQ